MKIVFCSNFLNHHQEEFSLNLYRLTNGNYTFIAYEPIDPERIKLGYEDMNKKHGFIVRAYESDEERKKAQKLIMESDVVIFGSGDEKALGARIKEGKLTFKYAERLLKRGLWFRFFPPKMLRTYNRFTKYKKYENFKMLCSSSYTSYDLSLSGFPVDKCYKWGYFPPVKEYENIDEIIENKTPKTILWVARFLELKHPEIAIELASKLKKSGIEFHLKMVGDGPSIKEIKELVKDKGLENEVSLAGSVSPDKVREYMEKSEVFIFTSDFHEGWGAVMNEAMNSGCACVASHAIGSVPYLIDDGVNGYIYKNGSLDELFEKVKDLLTNPQKRVNISKAAYNTIIHGWNSENAANSLINLCSDMLKNIDNPKENGPCSRAEVLSNNWYGE